MNELGQSILDILIKHTKEKEAHQYMKRGIESPERMNRRTYGCLSLLLIDNQIRVLAGMEPVEMPQPVRDEIKRMMKASEYIVLNGIGIVRKIPGAPKGEPGKPPVKGEKPVADGAVKKPKQKHNKKPAPTPEAPPTTLFEKIVTYMGGTPGDLEGCQKPETMHELTAERLLDAKNKLMAENTPHDINTTMMVSGISHLLSLSGFEVSADGKSIVGVENIN